ncbi:assimilatory sulfite reductase (NADPH) [Malassezia caprae]|uniref:assimilatory sulfite reductase (NADPH) n=1 Tax=Malassezia caprae TaxID=1381934 RepID=A0AAF0IWK5_9BASI|nr:assimilatory sulfite reductase (NADPH) [Malassezia caprae]
MASKSSALNGAALFAGGAFVGTSLYALARSFLANHAGKQSPVSDAPAARQALEAAALVKADGAVDDAGLYVAPSKDVAQDLYNVAGVMGFPYEARPTLPAVPTRDTRMDVGNDEPVPVALGPVSLDQPAFCASLLAMEMLVWENSGTVFTYESAVTGFGAYCEAQDDSEGPQVLRMQTRAGAGQAIAGFLAGEGSAARPAGERTTVSVLTNAEGLLAMGPALASVPMEGTDLVVHVSGASQATRDDLSVTNDYASALSTAVMLGDLGYEVLLSATPQESVDVAKYAYARTTKKPLVHIFDGAYAACERRVLSPPASSTPEPLAYTGPSAPETVLVMPNSTQSYHARALLLALPPALRSKVGVMSVRVLRPWSADALRAALPTSVKTLRVVEEAFAAWGGALYADVLEAVLGGALDASVQSLVLAPGQVLDAYAWVELLQAVAQTSEPVALESVLDAAARREAKILDLLSLSGSQLVTFFGADSGCTPAAAALLADALSGSKSAHVRLLARYDNYAAEGAVRTDLVFSERQGAEIPIEVLARDAQSHVVVISEPTALLRGYRLLEALRPEGTLVLLATAQTAEEVAGLLSAEDRQLLARQRVRVRVVDAQGVAHTLLDSVQGGKEKSLSAADLTASVVAAGVSSVVPALRTRTRGAPFAKDRALEQASVRAVAEIGTSGWLEAAPSDEAPAERAAHLAYNNVRPHAVSDGAARQVTRASWALAAWQLLFREAYATDEGALRPDLPERTYNVKVSVNKRLTPLEYDRNLFHMELDTAGTGLKYEVGEALGVHGWNDDDEVMSFIRWSGYNPEELVCAPSVTHPGATESRTVYQTLQQNLDIFGKPPKSFFEALGKVVASQDEAKWIRFISSAEGASTFKMLSESETVTYVDVLHMFPTARVSMDWLTKHVEPIKPRHYSIASAQVAVGDSVHLLIVTVDWKTPRGSLRYGQCTRYLSRLQPGTKVTVSIKPSVMKLPPHETQPIIMAGLGTGAAPFRAFLQARDYQRRQGKPIGPMYYYFGSRHRAMEYMYGEELEAYLADGVLTHLGLAFSRDQQKKVYIQHKIIEDGKQLTEYLMPELAAQGKPVDDSQRGIFTLCGPVWPVPDIQEALVSAFIEHGWTREQAEAKIAELKEEERYVLEVY